ncbi:MAG TPA: hypothetical protein VM681_10950 [Candidatus Thermoplasmatota archaeon]|nr:hypothetical protein [Candidatus Thermoplasmatota archaeon]
MRLVVLAAVGTLALAGCAAPPGEPVTLAEARTQLFLAGFSYEDQGCQDEVPFRITVENVGSAPAGDVWLSAQGGASPLDLPVGSIPVGGSAPITAALRLADTCDEVDTHVVVLSASARNAPSYVLRVQVLT